jgi:hypothetical protein
VIVYSRDWQHFLYEEQNSEHKTFSGRIVPLVKKLLTHQCILKVKTLPPMQVCFVKLVFNA